MRATQYLPDISRLQRCLHDNFKNQIDANKQTIGGFLKELPDGKHNTMQVVFLLASHDHGA